MVVHLHPQITIRTSLCLSQKEEWVTSSPFLPVLFCGGPLYFACLARSDCLWFPFSTAASLYLSFLLLNACTLATSVPFVSAALFLVHLWHWYDCWGSARCSHRVRGCAHNAHVVRTTCTDDLTVLAYAPDALQTIYVDDLTLLVNAPDALQTMLNRLMVFARSKHLPIKIAKSEVVHFNSKRVAQLPIFKLAGAAFKCSELLWYLGITFHKTLWACLSMQPHQCLQQLIVHVGYMWVRTGHCPTRQIFCFPLAR